jgi:hypothetical protein
MSKKESKSVTRTRDSKNGQFLPDGAEKYRPDTTERERVPKPGYGLTNRDKKK